MESNHNGNLQYRNPIVRARVLAQKEKEESREREAAEARELAAQRRIESCRERFFQLLGNLVALFERLKGLGKSLADKVEEIEFRRPPLPSRADLVTIQHKALVLFVLALIFVVGSGLLIYYAIDLLGHIPKAMRIAVAVLFALAAASGFHTYIRSSYPPGDDGRPKLSRRFVVVLLVVTIVSTLSVAFLRLLKDYVQLKQGMGHLTNSDFASAMLLLAYALGMLQIFLGLLLDVMAAVCSSFASGMYAFYRASLQVHNEHQAILDETKAVEEDVARTKVQMADVAAQVGPSIWQEWLKGRDAVVAVMIWLIMACGNLLVAQPKTSVAIVDETASTTSPRACANHEYVGEVIKHLKPGDELSVVAVNDASFAKPEIFLHGRIPRDDHPLQFASNVARNNLARRWQTLSDSLIIRTKISDVFGSICLGSLLLQDKAGERWMIVTSDFRNSTAILNIETMPEIPIEAYMAQLRQHQLVPDLAGVKVAVLGVHTEGVTLRYHTSLRLFIRAYFQAARAQLVAVRTDLSWVPFDAQGH